MTGIFKVTNEFYISGEISKSHINILRNFPINLPVEYEQINGLFTTLIRDIQKIE